MRPTGTTDWVERRRRINRVLLNQCARESAAPSTKFERALGVVLAHTPKQKVSFAWVIYLVEAEAELHMSDETDAIKASEAALRNAEQSLLKASDSLRTAAEISMDDLTAALSKIREKRMAIETEAAKAVALLTEAQAISEQQVYRIERLSAALEKVSKLAADRDVSTIIQALRGTQAR